MLQIPTPIGSTTNPPDVLLKLVTWSLMNLMAPMGSKLILSDVGNNEDSSQDILAMGIRDPVPISQVPRDDEVGDGPSVPPPQAPPPTTQDPIAHDEPIIQEQEQDPPQSDVVTQPKVDDAVDPRDRLDRI